MFDVEKDECGCDNVADSSGTEADVAEGFERGLEQRIAAFADGPDPVVDLVVGLLGMSVSCPPLGFLNATVMVPASPS
ncbi:hypothetical protein GCM10022251_29930 [Phytohabitans flavus]|uniref:Uncharacterized protein n=1 Tax=Phytohabitans flavus TaxID=1076124 RepID=A0A6F8XXA4_9ACTN|nr:hypothetical protein Pflav_048370 [Phytohabitans flavus]